MRKFPSILTLLILVLVVNSYADSGSQARILAVEFPQRLLSNVVFPAASFTPTGTVTPVFTPTADPDAPALNSEWGFIGDFYGIELDSADDFFRFPEGFPFPLPSDFINSIFDSAQGANFAVQMFGNTPQAVWQYLLDRDASVFDALRIEALQLIPGPALAILPDAVQQRAAEGGTPSVTTAHPTVAPTEAPPAPLGEIAARTGDVVSEFAGSVTSVCLVTDIGRINDGSFNESAYNGMVAAARDFNLNSTFIETQSQADYETNIQICVDEGYSAIVTVGFLMANATRAAAEANPDAVFIGVDQGYAEPLPNLVGIVFREDQAGFLAGVMAALVTESGKIGGVYGEEIPPVVKFRNGFEQGAKYINPEIEIFGVYVGSFIDQPAGRETAENMIGEGVDVIFGAGGPTGSAGIQLAAEMGIMVIGVDVDEYFTTFGHGEARGSENIITSAVKRVDQGVYDMLAALTVGTVAWPDTSLYLMEAANAGVGFAPANDADVPAEVIAQVEETLAMLAAGELVTGVDPVTGELLAG